MVNNKEKKYVSDYPHLIAEWDWELNTIDPYKITHGSTKHAHWICMQKHKFSARIDHRTIMGSGCPYCAGKLPIPGQNDLATTHPYLIVEWDYEKNTKKPEDYLAGSNSKASWICRECGNHWDTSIYHRAIKNSKCPECMRIQRGKTKTQTTIALHGSLADVYPKLAAQWDYSKNGELKPTDVHSNSKSRVWWLCEKGHSWSAIIQNRVTGNGCPVCSGKAVLIGFNDLETTFPDIAAQWHPTKNEKLLPSMVTARSGKRVWWLCPTCNEDYRAIIYSRTSQGNGCPVCANKVVRVGINDLATTHPHIAKEWHPTKNGILKPTDIVAGSNSHFWWRCEKGHSWRATANDRKSGRGCPYCNNEHSSSFPEQLLYYYLQQTTCAINRHKLSGREIDIYLPTLNIGIEYNGQYYHQNRKQQDAEKYDFLRSQGVRIIVVHEGDQEFVDGDNIFYRYKNSDYLNLDRVVYQVLELCALPAVDVDIQRDRPKIYEQFIFQEKLNSIAVKYPWLIEEWDYERNGKLTPWLVSYGSHKRIHWKCRKCNYHWLAVAYSRKTSGCPRCANRVVVPGKNDLATTHPYLLSEWDYDKNTILPTEVIAGSQRYAWWQCEHKHSWKAQIISRKNGTGCPICNK